MTARRAAAMALLATAIAAPSHAQSAPSGSPPAPSDAAPTEPVELQYDVPANCPSRARFSEEVAALTPKAEFVDARPGIRRFAVAIAVRRGQVSGKLGIEAGGEHSEREVSGKTCKEVVSALALATAIAVDPNLLGGASSAANQPPATAQAERDDEDDEDDGAAPEHDRQARDRSAYDSRSRSHWLFALGIGVMNGNAPSAAVVPSLRLAYRPTGRYAPELFLEADGALPVSAETDSYAEAATFWALFARSGVTWEPLHLEGTTLGLSLGVEIGRVVAEGTTDPDRHTSEERNWLALDGGLSATLPIPAPFFWRAELGALVPFFKHEYRVLSPTNEPENVHIVPDVGFRLSVLGGFFL